ncbi:hypothetical protein EDEG_03446 [Edhazardia aedis USNM 41457]|uniref:Uncharacterized protein n=1 Tax=Edhazardia aedis (strain USNM 41457) TaxID=1003232 RepID=J9DL77_EDHAE|nr:hypothetical protein EDEG_03446 [Edhazardia aedis USNM 41457]|eukprot:EJW02107.1 hypothetical protein EDEG_03446 [Edhazardia aedis USNM 41457]
MYKKISYLLLESLRGLEKLFSFAIENKINLQVMDNSGNYNSQHLIHLHLEKMDLTSFQFNEESIQIIKNNIIIFSEFFLHVWKLIIKIKYEKGKEYLPHILIQKEELSEKCSNQCLEIRYNISSQTRYKYHVLYNLRIKFLCVFEEHNRMVEIFISIFHSEKPHFAIRKAEDNGLFSDIKSYFTEITQNMLKFELYAIYLIACYNSYCVLEHVSLFEDTQLSKKISDYIDSLSRQDAIMKDFLSNCVFKVQKKIITKVLVADTQTDNNKVKDTDNETKKTTKISRYCLTLSQLAEELKKEKILKVQLVKLRRHKIDTLYDLFET